jgi:hypothetical protein
MIDQAPDTWHDIVGRSYADLYDSAPQMFAQPNFVTAEDADAKAMRSFWRGVVFGGLLVGLTFIGWAAL